MQINGISSIPPVDSITPVQPLAGPGSRVPVSTTASATSTKSPQPAQSKSASSASSTAATKPAATKPAATSSSHKASGGGGGGSSASTTASNASELVAAVYTTTVNGKTYSGSVEESNGQYVASVPGLSGASAGGASPVSAENALGSIIDELA